MRKVIQVSNSVAQASDDNPEYSQVIALCDDGTMWEHLSLDKGWTQLPPIPQPEISTDDMVMPNVCGEKYWCIETLSWKAIKKYSAGKFKI